MASWCCWARPVRPLVEKYIHVKSGAFSHEGSVNNAQGLQANADMQRRRDTSYWPRSEVAKVRLSGALAAHRSCLPTEVSLMSFVLTIREGSHGLWCICNGADVVFDRLLFADAIRLSHDLARKEHHRSGGATWIEMVCNECSIPLAKYSDAAGSLAASAV